MHEIEAGELKQKIDRGDNLYILDVRTPQEYKAWKISDGIKICSKK
jgi:rhodanese-related sulfurtransferase